MVYLFISDPIHFLGKDTVIKLSAPALNYKLVFMRLGTSDRRGSRHLIMGL